MAVEVVSLGVQKLWDLLSQEYKQFQGFEDQITELKSNLTLLKSFFKDADAKKHTSEIVRNYVEEIKEIIYDAEDTIETFILKEELGKTSGIKKRIKRFAFTVMDRKELASDIGEISKRISKVIQDMQSFGVQQMIANGSRLSSHPLQERQREMRQEFARDYESNLVGLEANVEKLVAYLVKGDDIQIVSLTGMGGVGKTTLARQVFNHEDVKDHFDGLAWVCVSQEFTRISVWQTILQNFTSKEKVLLTSRKEGVAVCGDTSYIHFKPECLTIQNSWKLFEMVAMPRRDASKFKIDEEMEEIGKQMIKHCGGLPLAIKVLGGLLATKYSSHEWKRVFEDIGSHIVGRTNFNDHNNSLIYHVLSMSFEELPNYLKKCFLYLAHFPEDYHIDIGGMALLWAAEGIIEPRHYDGEAIRNIVDSYIEELVRRNMVISKRSVTTLRFETCHLHDMMREICLFKAKEENFLHIVSIRSPTSNSQSPGTSRRLVLHYPTTLHIVRDINNSKLRSLVVVFDFLWRESWMISGSSFTRLKLVRVLDLYKAKFTGGKLPSGIGKLIHLRYLSLEETKVSHLPSSLGNLMLLIYLNINVDVEDIFVPNVLMGMQELRYLALPRHMHKKTKLELSNLVNLETLENFSTWNSSLEDLRIMERLHTLTIILTREAVMENLYASIGGLRHLENLKIVEDDGFNMRIEEGIVLDLIHLRYLTLDIQIPRLPKEQRFPSHLTTISLLRCRLEEDPMPILEKLLHLNVVDLVHESFSGRRMVCSGSGFPKLHVLAIFGLEEWEEWIVEEGSMPLLHTLRIWKCPKLKELPDGLPFIHSLKELDMDEEWKVRLSKGGEEYYKVQHIPLVKCLW